MKINNYLMLMLICFTLIGCGAVGIKDNLPEGIKKGYVEFYKQGYLRSGHCGIIYRIQDNKAIREGTTCEGWTNFSEKEGLCLAKVPGNYLFEVYLMEKRLKRVEIEVKEGMLTPVRIDVILAGVYQEGTKKVERYNAFVTVEELVPMNVWVKKWGMSMPK